MPTLIQKCTTPALCGFSMVASAGPPEPLGGRDLVLSEKGLGTLQFGKEFTFTSEALLRAYPDHRVSLLHTDGLILAMITTLESWEGKELFSIFTYGDEKGSQWNANKRIDAICVKTPKIPDSQGVTVGMTYNEVARATGKTPSIERGEAGLAYLKVGDFSYLLSTPEKRDPNLPDGQTEKEIRSGACKVSEIYWHEVPW